MEVEWILLAAFFRERKGMGKGVRAKNWNGVEPKLCWLGKSAAYTDAPYSAYTPPLMDKL